ncbi:MAG TPA: hypothetical protein PLG90_04520 [Ignavibacteria bacterium]|nr:hypothetical protein [Ignavibacteria bacterium]
MDEFSQIFNTFSEQDKINFKKFLDSPFFNEDKKLCEIYELYLNGKSTGDIVKLKKLVSFADRFLAEIKFEKNLYLKNKLIIQESISRKLKDKTEFYLNLNEDIASEENDENEDNLFRKYETYSNYWLHLLSQNKNYLGYDFNVLALEYLITFSIVESVKLAMNIIGSELRFEEAPKTTFGKYYLKELNMDSLVNFLRENNSPNSFLVDIYNKIFKSILFLRSKEYFISLKETIEANFDRMEKSVKENVLTNTYNICLFRSKFDRTFYKKELFAINKLLIKAGLYNEEKKAYMSLAMFTSTLRNAIWNKELNWAEDFIRDCIKYLEPEMRSNMQVYSNAYMSIAKKDFKSALDYLSKVEMNFRPLEYQVRLQTINCYYELSEYAKVKEKLAEFSKFLDIKEKEYYFGVNSYVNYINTINKILDMKTGKKVFDESVFSDLKSRDDIANKEWLLSKLDEIKNGT